MRLYDMGVISRDGQEQSAREAGKTARLPAHTVQRNREGFMASYHLNDHHVSNISFLDF